MITEQKLRHEATVFFRKAREARAAGRPRLVSYYHSLILACRKSLQTRRAAALKNAEPTQP